MISQGFYISDLAVQYFHAKTIKHFPIKDKTHVISKVPYTIKESDTIYSIASNWFGENNQFHWTIITDLNNYIRFEDLQVGDIIYLPKIIIKDTIERVSTYEQNSSTAIKV